MDLSGIEDTLGAIFFAISLRFGSHWEISPAEAKKLEVAVARVARHYSFAQTQKMADWTRLMLVAGNIGLPRAMQSAFNSRATQTARPRQSPVAPPASPSAPTAGSQPPPAGPVAPTIRTPGQLDPVSMMTSHATSGSVM